MVKKEGLPEYKFVLSGMEVKLTYCCYQEWIVLDYAEAKIDPKVLEEDIFVLRFYIPPPEHCVAYAVKFFETTSSPSLLDKKPDILIFDGRIEDMDKFLDVSTGECSGSVFYQGRRYVTKKIAYATMLRARVNDVEYCYVRGLRPCYYQLDSLLKKEWLSKYCSTCGVSTHNQSGICSTCETK